MLNFQVILLKHLNLFKLLFNFIFQCFQADFNSLIIVRDHYPSLNPLFVKQYLIKVVNRQFKPLRIVIKLEGNYFIIHQAIARLHFNFIHCHIRLMLLVIYFCPKHSMFNFMFMLMLMFAKLIIEKDFNEEYRNQLTKIEADSFYW